MAKATSPSALHTSAGHGRHVDVAASGGETTATRLERDGRWLSALHGGACTAGLGSLDETDTMALRTAAKWSVEFLTNPHPDLGRDGEVCPYTGPSMRKGAFYMTVSTDLSVEAIIETMQFYREWFAELEPVDHPGGQLKTIVIVFSKLGSDAGALLDEAQAKLKYEFVRQGLMVGQFHPNCEEPGVRNSSFRPLRGPVPMLAIRHMVAGDGRFLVGDPHHLGSYLAYFGTKIPPELEDIVHDAMARHDIRVLVGQLVATVSKAKAAA